MIFLYYIQEADKPNRIFEIFNIIQLRQDNIILSIDNENLPSKKAQKLAQKTKHILSKTNSKKIVISKNMQKQKEYINLLHTYQLEIVDGNWLFELLSCKILEYVLKQNNLVKEQTPITILVNDLTEITRRNIIQIAKEYKRVSIITNHIEKLKKMEKKIWQKEGIMITVGNNKKKGLAKAKLILNIDFPSELVNQYNVYEKAILVNIKHNVKIQKKRFDGIVVNDYDIKFRNLEEIDYEKNQKYKACQLYEANFNKKQPYNEIMKKIQKDRVEVMVV